MESGSDEEPVMKPKKHVMRQKLRSENPEDVNMEDVDGYDPVIIQQDTGNKAKSPGKPLNSRDALVSNKKRKSLDLEDESESEDFNSTKKRPNGKGNTKEPPAKRPRAKKEEAQENGEIQAIFDSITTVRAPTPPPRDPNNKFDWRAGAAGGGNSGPPPAAGAKEIPTGAENCLLGLTFVFTGLLETISRDEGQELVKRHGGRITGTPSSKTSYVVLGSDAGPSKLEKIRAMNIKTINEDGLFELIRRLPAGGGGGKAAEQSSEKLKAEQERVKREAAEMEKEEKKLAAEIEKAAKDAAVARGFATAVPRTLPTSQLWTSKYAPTKTNQICGNKGQVEKIQKWLEKWPKSRKHDFLLPGPDGSGKFRALIIHGPPGIGKTSFPPFKTWLGDYSNVRRELSP
jgi:replication factor C subunit 1